MQQISLSDYDSVFQNGRLPDLIYVTQQRHDSQELIRPMHGHENIAELLLVYEGSGSYNIDDEHYEIKKGDVLLYNAGSLHEVSTRSDQNIGTLCFGITNLSLPGLPENHLTSPDKGFVRYTNEHFEEIKTISNLIYACLNESENYEKELCRHLMISLIILSIRLPGSNTSVLSKKEYFLVKKIKQHIDTNFREDITVDSLAADLHISTSYASHLFKKATGYSIKKYLSRRRIGEAETQLLCSDASVTEIAMMVGFNDSNYFNTVFSKTVGYTPLQYRKAYHVELRGIHTQ